MSDKTWQRRRDTATMPNWMVRFIYWVVDFLGEFGDPMRSAGSRIGKSIMFFVEITILLCLFFFSALHSFEMLEKFNITGISQWLAIVFFEIQFLHSSIALDIAKKRGQKAGNRKAIFIICLLFVEVSNVTALWGSIGGVLIGGVMPIMLLLSKGSLKDRSIETEDSRTKVEPAVPVIEQKPDETIEENPVPETIEPITLEDEKIPEIPVEIIEEKPDEKTEKNDPLEQAPALEMEPEKIEENEPEKTPEISTEKAEEKSEDKPKRTKRSSSKKRSRKNSKKTAVNYDHVLAVAEQLKNDEKIDASQLEKEVAEKADCSKYYAKKALAELEQKEAEKEEIPELKNEPKFAVVAGGRN